MPKFDLIPANELRVDQPDFKASVWRKNNSRHSRVEEYSECYEWVGGKWEGFVSIRLADRKSRKPLPKSLTSCLA